MEMAYNTGRNAKADNSKSNKAEFANFWRAIQHGEQTEEYGKSGKLFRFMMTTAASPMSPNKYADDCRPFSTQGAVETTCQLG